MKALFGYIGCMAVAAFLAYYITGTGGLFILFLFAVAIIADVIIFAFSSKRINVSLISDREIINKGQKVKVKIHTENASVLSFLPSGFVRAEIDFTPNLSPEDQRIFRFVTVGKSSEPVEINLCGDYCGKGRIFVKELSVSDFLGILNHKIQTDASCIMKVMPPVVDVTTQGEVIKNVSDNMTFDDSEEETDESSLVPTGIPGYDHRPYVPGDPLKRINWKISSKRGNLMVRLDEKSVSTSSIIQLDFPAVGKITREYYKNGDKMICASLAMLSMLLKQGFESEYILFVENHWENIPIKDEKSLQYLQEKLAEFMPCSLENRFPPKSMNKKNKGVICFTACTNLQQGELNSFIVAFHGTLAVSKESGIGKIEGTDVWSVDEDYKFSKL